jgi:hypothetical protein
MADAFKDAPRQQFHDNDRLIDQMSRVNNAERGTSRQNTFGGVDARPWKPRAGSSERRERSKMAVR